MCPSFSLCACRILKMRSCLRRPLAPGSSRDRAILVSSVIFFSFSSAMVIFTYRMDFSGGFSRGSLAAVWAHGGAALSSPPLCFGKILRFAQNVTPLCSSDPVKHLVHGFLDAGIGPVKFASSLRGQLTKHVPVPQSLHCIEYTIRAHLLSFS